MEKPNSELGGAALMGLAIFSPAGADAVIELQGGPNDVLLKKASGPV